MNVKTVREMLKLIDGKLTVARRDGKWVVRRPSSARHGDFDVGVLATACREAGLKGEGRLHVGFDRHRYTIFWAEFVIEE